MHAGRLVFAQLMAHMPLSTFRHCVERYQGHYKVHSFSCLDQFLALGFAQLSFRESLRDIEACLRAQSSKLYHMGIRSKVARNTLANANAQRDWRIYADFAQHLIAIARRLYAEEPLGIELKQVVYALDATTIDLCLSLFPWAPFRQTKAAVKLHTLLDLRGNIPTFLHISDGRFHEVNVLDLLVPEAGAFYVMDRGFLDFERLNRLDAMGAFFVTRARSDFRFKRLTARKVDKSKRLVFLTNHFGLPAIRICQLYRLRWQVELFFKWIKQHLRIKAFYGTSENAVKTQIWTAVCIYVLVAIVRKRLKLAASMHELLQILSLTLFEQTPLDQLLTSHPMLPNESLVDNQLNLFA